MKPHLKKFIYKTILLSAIISFATLLVFTILLKEFYLPIYPFVIIFFAIVSISVHYILLKSSQRKANFFVNNFMMSTIIKLFVYLGFVAIYLVFDKQNKIPFIIFFMINYLVFSVFEISTLLSDLKNAN